MRVSDEGEGKACSPSNSACSLSLVLSLCSTIPRSVSPDGKLTYTHETLLSNIERRDDMVAIQEQEESGLFAKKSFV